MKGSMQLSINDLKGLYLDLITTVVPGPASWSYFVPLILLPLGLLVPPTTLSHGQLCALILPIGIITTIHAWTVLGGNDVISTDSLYMTFFLYAFKDPRRNFRRVIRCGQDEALTEEKRNDVWVDSEPVFLEAYPEIFKKRLTWALMLPQSRPLHDWIIGNPGHDRRVLLPFHHPTRSEFMQDVFSRLAPVLSVFLPLSKQLARDDSYFSDPNWSIFGPYSSESESCKRWKAVAVLQKSLPAIVIRPMTMAMYAYSLLLCMFLPPMLLALLLNAIRIIPDRWSPHTMRPHFGPLSAIEKHGVRGFWGQWWHQQMRHIVSEPGSWLAAKLGLVEHGWQKTLKYLLICISAFLLSGITHSGMVPPNPRFATVSAIKIRLRLASFFWVQPVGIMMEILVIEPFLRRFPTSVRGLQGPIRVLWTVVFMSLACTQLVMPFGQLGYWNISLLRALGSPSMLGGDLNMF